MKVGTKVKVNPHHLYPTQFCLGYKEITYKEKNILKMNKSRYEEYLKEKITPAVIGPYGKIYIIDHHHHARSLINLHKTEILIEVIANCEELTPEQFKEYMIAKKYVNLYNAQGKSEEFEKLPQNLIEMQHDFFRSLAWAVREENGFKKVDEIPFFEFRWGEFFRSYITEKLVAEEFKLATMVALKLALSDKAQNLPGFLGKKGNKG